MSHKSSFGLVKGGGHQAATAGTTQTQAGATAITAGNVACTTGTANDGLALPRADQPTHINQELIVQNLSANALKVYPYYTSAATNVDDGTAYGGTVDGGAANAAITHAASTTRKYICTAKNTWKSILT